MADPNPAPRAPRPASKAIKHDSTGGATDAADLARGAEKACASAPPCNLYYSGGPNFKNHTPHLATMAGFPVWLLVWRENPVIISDFTRQIH